MERLSFVLAKKYMRKFPWIAALLNSKRYFNSQQHALSSTNETRGFPARYWNWSVHDYQAPSNLLTHPLLWNQHGQPLMLQFQHTIFIPSAIKFWTNLAFNLPWSFSYIYLFCIHFNSLESTGFHCRLYLRNVKFFWIVVKFNLVNC